MILTKVSAINGLDNLAELGYDGIDISFCKTIYTNSERDTILDGDWKKKLDLYKEKCKDVTIFH